MHVQPYLHFDGRCDEAIEFYKSKLGAVVDFLIRFKECPEPNPQQFPPELAEKVMHATVRIGDTVMNFSDGRCQGKPVFAGISLSLTVSSDAEAERMFGGLTDGGKITMPLTKTFFSPRFGMVIDRFGVSWMIILRQ